MLATLKRLWKDEDAPTAVEYGIMVALIAIVIIVGAGALGVNLNALFQRVADTTPIAGTTGGTGTGGTGP